MAVVVPLKAVEGLRLLHSDFLMGCPRRGGSWTIWISPGDADVVRVFNVALGPFERIH